jgi:hypothetical protein
MKVKTSNLKGAALDWAVFLASYGRAPNPTRCVEFSTDWAQGGPILTKARISRTIDHSGLWVAYWADGYDDSDESKKWMHCDRDELVAGLRCFVASELGDTVEIPNDPL